MFFASLESSNGAATCTNDEPGNTGVEDIWGCADPETANNVGVWCNGSGCRGDSYALCQNVLNAQLSSDNNDWSSGAWTVGGGTNEVEAAQLSDDTYGGVLCCRLPPTSDPTASPSVIPTQTPSNPTNNPSATPTQSPSRSPTIEPTEEPTTEPTVFPSKAPTESPSRFPTRSPSIEPTTEPTTDEPTSNAPTVSPSKAPSQSPSIPPTGDPTQGPSSSPTRKPTDIPSKAPTKKPISVDIPVYNFTLNIGGNEDRDEDFKANISSFINETLKQTFDEYNASYRLVVKWEGNDLSVSVISSKSDENLQDSVAEVVNGDDFDEDLNGNVDNYNKAKGTTYTVTINLGDTGDGSPRQVGLALWHVIVIIVGIVVIVAVVSVLCVLCIQKKRSNPTPADHDSLNLSAVQQPGAMEASNKAQGALPEGEKQKEEALPGEEKKHAVDDKQPILAGHKSRSEGLELIEMQPVEAPAAAVTATTNRSESSASSSDSDSNSMENMYKAAKTTTGGAKTTETPNDHV